MGYKLYGLHGCGMCAALEQQMREKGVPYEKIEDKEKIMAMDLDSIPALDTGDKVMYFPEAIMFLRNTQFIYT